MIYLAGWERITYSRGFLKKRDPNMATLRVNRNQRFLKRTVRYGCPIPDFCFHGLKYTSFASFSWLPLGWITLVLNRQMSLLYPVSGSL